MRIAFHRHLDVRVPRNLLKRLDVDPGGSRHRDVGVPENVRRCVMQVDLPANPLPQAREGALRQGLFSVPENKATFLPFRQQDDPKLGVQQISVGRPRRVL